MPRRWVFSLDKFLLVFFFLVIFLRFTLVLVAVGAEVGSTQSRVHRRGGAATRTGSIRDGAAEDLLHSWEA